MGYARGKMETLRKNSFSPRSLRTASGLGVAGSIDYSGSVTLRTPAYSAPLTLRSKSASSVARPLGGKDLHID